MIDSTASLEIRIDRLHRNGLVDMHFDMLMDLYEKRRRSGVLDSDYLPALQAGGIGVVGVAIFLEDHYLPEMALRVALGQITRLYAEVEQSAHFAICKSYAEIVAARQAGRIALAITMEGVEPLGTDLELLRAFYELGVRSLGLSHSRRNMAADGGIFAPQGSSPGGLSPFGRAVVQQCQALGIILDLAHLNPAGIDDVLALTSGPLIISHTNPRAFFDIERNSSDDQLRAVGRRGGVIGVNSVLLSNRPDQATLERYIDHIEYVAELAGLDSVGIGFDFLKFIYDQWSPELQARIPVCFPPGLLDHADARNVTGKLIERGFSDGDIEKILYGNWLRLLAEML
jgi:membrane dipeptidase